MSVNYNKKILMFFSGKVTRYAFTALHKNTRSNRVGCLLRIWEESCVLSAARTLLKRARVPMLCSWKPLSGDWLMGAVLVLIMSFGWSETMLD